MRHNKLLHSLLLLSFMLYSCATASDEPAVPGKESGITGIPSEGTGEISIEDPVSDQNQEVSTAEEPSELGIPTEEETLPPVEEGDTPVKETRKGGRKEIPAVDIAAPAASEEDMTDAPNEPSLTAALAPDEEDASDPSAVEPAPGEIPDEDPKETALPGADGSDGKDPDNSPVISGRSSGEADIPPKEEDYSVTVVNELSMGSPREELPSERDDVDYNPLLPIVVDAPTTAGDSAAAGEPSSEEETEDTDVSDSIDSGEDSDTAETSVAAIPAVPSVPADIPSNEGVSDIDPQELDDLYIDGTGKLIIELQGSGWIYIASEGEDSLSLKDKSYNPDSGTTRFVFTSSSSAGPTGKLVFLKQDLLRGESSRKSLDLEAALPQESPEDGLSTSDETRTVRVQENASESLTEATGRGDTEAVVESSDSSEEPSSEPGGDAPQLSEDTISYDNAAALLRLARKYESPGPDQSLEKALELYYRIKREFPVTEERFIAETRIRYLNKHYFKVQ